MADTVFPDVDKQKKQSGICREGVKQRLLLGITGGVAAYKAAELARLLTQAGIIVQTVMTASACRFIGPVTIQSLTGQAVYTELWETNAASNMAHIQLTRNADLILIAPASANFIGKLAGGMADDLLSTLCLARDCSMMIAPAMNRQMWMNPATQRNIQRLQEDGIRIIGPASGEQACGEVGMGRMLEAHELLEAVLAALNTGPAIIPQLRQKHVLITAGPTYEPIDPVRGITNRSSGKMGYAIAQAALEAGSRVTLISGPVCLEPPSAAQIIHVLSAQDMFNAVEAEIAGADIFISVAAVADYRVAGVSAQKLKKSDQKIQLELVPNPDILQHVTDRKNPPFCVGFAAETDHLEHHAVLKRAKKSLPLLVANQAQETLGADEAALVLFDDAGRHYFAKAAKSVQARKLVEHIAALYAQQDKQ
jgi:phosphopantothenoylcysteine decarboxylase / phosphopantothenate---cysteine ligase